MSENDSVAHPDSTKGGGLLKIHAEEGEIIDKEEKLRKLRSHVRQNCQVHYFDIKFITHLSQMHPTSALHEICQKLGIPQPNMTMALECGPPMAKQYIFKAVVNGHTYQPTIAVDNKKDAKAKAAWLALQEMGFLKKNPSNPL